jgi:xylan 1,4-beta-xylosidase
MLVTTNTTRQPADAAAHPPSQYRKTRESSGSLLLRLLTVLAVLGGVLILGPAANAATISADFGAIERPRLKVGFLHNLSAAKPTDDLLVPLRPTAWRSNEASAPAARVRALGASHTIVLSDHWSYPAHDWRPFGAPWTQLDRYAAWVRQFAQGYKGRGVFYWDVWNEPDFEIFWNGTREQFFETFAVAERVLREELGADARIVGPSTTMWRLDWIEALAEFCLRRGCRFDAVSWHDLPNDLRSLPRLSERVATSRELLSRPRYRSLRVQEFHVNEIMGHHIQFMPGAAVGYFSELESGNADVAIKSCWPDSRGRVNCEGQTLNGLLEWDTGQPRPLWYTWRAYSDGRSSRVRSTSGDARIAVLASRRSGRPGDAQLLLGNIGSARRAASVRLCGLTALSPGHKRASRATVFIERYPYLEEAVAAPTLDDRPRRLRLDERGRCAVGRLPLPGESGALVAYLQIR